MALLDAPDGFVGTLLGLPDGVDIRRRLPARERGPCDVIVSFHIARAHLARRLPDLLGALAVDGALWVAWPKRASGVPTDITEDVVRDVVLPTGMVDNKVCAIDEVWSGLRLVLRREHRAGRATCAAPREASA